MKKTLTLTLVLLIALTSVLISCGNVDADPFETATYTEDTSLGEGSITYTLKVVVGDRTVTFTIKTDEDNLGAALRKSGIVEGDDGPYGLYIKKVNGIVADYDVNGAYWALSINGEAASTGADGISLKNGGCYELTYSK